MIADHPHSHTHTHTHPSQFSNPVLYKPPVRGKSVPAIANLPQFQPALHAIGLNIGVVTYIVALYLLNED